MSTVVDRHSATLNRDGWCVIERALDPALLCALEADLVEPFAKTPLCQGAFYGERTRRFGSLLTRSPLACGFRGDRAHYSELKPPTIPI